MRRLLELFLEETRLACLVLAGDVAGVLNQRAFVPSTPFELVDLQGMGLSLLEDSAFELGLWPLTDSFGV